MKKWLILIAFLVLFVGQAMAFTAPTFPNQPMLIESDKYFYGSDQGQVTIDLNITTLNPNFKDFFVRIKGLDNTNTFVKEISFNKEKTESISYHISETSKTKISQKLLNKTPMQIVLTFDPEEIGFGKEFDIQLVDKDGKIISDLDPFLSGWNYRQEWTLNTDGISLSGNVTNDHTILFTKYSDSSFWGNVASSGADIRFTNSDNTEYDFYLEKWDYANNEMVAWVEITETFDSTTDVTGYLYYGNDSATGDTNHEAVFPSSYVAVYDFNSCSGSTIFDKTSNNVDLTLNAAGSWERGKHGCSVDLDNSNYTNLIALPSSLSTWTVRGWAYINANTDNDLLFPYENVWGGILRRNACADNGVGVYGATWLCGGSLSTTTWGSWAGDYDDGTKGLTVNGARVSEADTVPALSYVGLGVYRNGSGGETLNGNLDSVRIFNYVLSADEIKLLDSADNNSLVSFATEEAGVINYDIDFNIYLAGTTTHLTNVTLDFNVDAYDVSDDSPITVADMNASDFLVTVSKAGFDSNTNYFFTADADKTITIYLSDSVAPDTNIAGNSAGWTQTDQNIILSCSDSGSGCNVTQYRIDGGEWLNFDTNILFSTDGNHQLDYNSSDVAGNLETTKTVWIAIDKTAPIIVVGYMNGGEVFANPTNIDINFYLTDYYSPLLIDINYSTSNEQGTGTPIIVGASTAGIYLLCSTSDFSGTGSCEYTWNATSVPDGNYYLLMAVHDAFYSGFDASDGDFNFYSPDEIVVTTEEPYSERYINPAYDQRDENIYYNPNQAYELTDSEKQNIYLQQTTLILLIIAVVVGIGVLILWKRKK